MNAPLIYYEAEREKCLKEMGRVSEWLARTLHDPTTAEDPWKRWAERLRARVARWHVPFHTTFSIVPLAMPEHLQVQLRVRWAPMSWVDDEASVGWSSGENPEIQVVQTDWDGTELETNIAVSKVDPSWRQHLSSGSFLVSQEAGHGVRVPAWTSEMDNQAFSKRMRLKRRAS